MPFAPIVPLGSSIYSVLRPVLRSCAPHLTVAWSLALSCIFLTLSLRLLSSVCGFFMIILHVLKICWGYI
ncbi:hypothetical protein EV2_039230 [Malus domestica]